MQFRPDGTIAARTPGGVPAVKLARSADGNVWLSGPGVSRVTLKNGDLSIEPEDLAGEHTLGWDIEFENQTRKLWACYSGGLIVKQDRGWRNITTADGLLQNPCESMAPLPNGDVWFGYYGLPAFALVHFDSQNRVHVRQFHEGGEIGKSDNYFLHTDNRGWIWRGASDGLHVADPSEAEAGVWLHIADSDGLPPGADGPNQNAFFSDSDGTVWWGASADVVHFNPPPDFVHPSRTPDTFLSGFSLDNAAPQLAETVHQIPHGVKVVAHIGSSEFEHRNALRLRYRLLPEETAWREGRDLDLNLGTPSWGSHSLEVQTRFSTGAWTGTLRRSIVVLRPLWLSWQVLLGFAGLVLAAIAGAVAWRRKLRRRASIAFPDLNTWRVAALSPEIQTLLGATLDSRFEVGALLARGGFATVLKGRDLAHDGRPCAIKVFRPELNGRDWLTRRFRQEVSALEQVRHPNVVEIYGHGTTPTAVPYLVMEFIDGLTLRDLLISETPLPPARAASFLLQTARALDEIHARGICHRDLKPENLMIRATSPDDEALVLIDFSIAIVKDPDQTIHGLSRAAGTLHYMAPEQAVGYASPASDVYSLAKIALETITGRRLSELLPDASLDLPLRVREFAAGLPFRLLAAIDLTIGSGS